MYVAALSFCGTEEARKDHEVVLTAMQGDPRYKRMVEEWQVGLTNRNWWICIDVCFWFDMFFPVLVIYFFHLLFSSKWTNAFNPFFASLLIICVAHSCHAFKVQDLYLAYFRCVALSLSFVLPIYLARHLTVCTNLWIPENCQTAAWHIQCYLNGEPIDLISWPPIWMMITKMRMVMASNG